MRDVKKSINDFQPGRYGYEQERKPKFPAVVNPHLAGFGLEIKVLEEGGDVPDYVVVRRSDGKPVAYLEAEFALEGRWPTGQPFKYDTIRWPERKYERYRASGGLYNGLPVFMITIRGGDLGDAYYMDARTWISKAKKERVWGSIFWGVSKDDEDLGHGLEGLGKYIIDRITSCSSSHL